MRINVQAFLQGRGWNHRQAGNEYQVETCPLCGDTGYHLYINASSGLWKCHKCGEAGNIYKLGFNKAEENLYPVTRQNNHPPPDNLSGRIQKAQERLLQDNQALDYLRDERGFQEGTIKNFHLGLEVNGGKKWITIPHFSKGVPVNIKSRSLPPAAKEFMRVPGCPSVLFNSDSLQGAEEVILCEGELDAVTLHQAGFKNVIGITCGAGSFKPEWIKALEPVKKIFLCFDNDFTKKDKNTGQEGARRLARRLGYERVKNILLPVKDANEFFKAGYTAEEFARLMNEAQPFKPGNLFTLRESIELACSQPADDSRGIETEWDNLNRLTGRFKPGDLIVLSARPKTGKTTFSLNIAVYNAMLKNHPVLFYCLEMRPERILRKMASRLYKKRDEDLLQPDIRNLMIEIPDNSFIIGSGGRNVTLESVEETIRAAVRLYDTQLVIFDHLHFLVRSLGQQTQEVGNAVRSFKLLAEELEIPIILVAQPRKGSDDNVIGIDDLRDSYMIGADADQVIVLHRKKIKSDIDNAGLTESLSPETLVRVDASRYHPGGDCGLYFKGQYSFFEDYDREKAARQSRSGKVA